MGQSKFWRKLKLPASGRELIPEFPQPKIDITPEFDAEK
jgi:hypothetical protein